MNLAAQYLISDPANIFYQKDGTKCEGVSLVVGQQKVETVHIGRYSIMYLIKKEDPNHQITAKQNNPTPFRPLEEISVYEPHFTDPEY